MISYAEIIIFYTVCHNFFTKYHKERDIIIIEKFIKFLNDINIPIKIITPVKKIITCCVRSHNFNTGYHNIDTRCHNFFRKKEHFHHLKFQMQKSNCEH